MIARLTALRSLFALSALALIAGCQSYQLGSPTPIPFESIYVKPVTNSSYAPQAQALLSSNLREAFISDGRLKLVRSEEDADIVLLVDITEYSRRSASLDSEDTVVATDFDLFLETEVSLFDQNKGAYLFTDRKILERTNTYVDNPYADPTGTDTDDFLQSEYNAMPRLTRGLARKIADEVLSPWESR